MERFDFERTAGSGQGDHCEIQCIGFEITQDFVDIADTNNNLEIGHTFLRYGDGARQQMNRGRAAAADPHAADRSLPKGRHRLLSHGAGFDNAPCIRKQIMSGRRGLRPPPDALDQSHAEALFQQLYLQADGRL